MRLEKLYVAIVETFDLAVVYIINAIQQSSIRSKYTKRSIGIDELDLNDTILRNVSNAIQAFVLSAKSIVHSSYMSNLDEFQESTLLNEWDYWLSELEIKVNEWDDIFLLDEEIEAKWIEFDTRSIPGSLTVIKRPLHIHDEIKQSDQPNARSRRDSLDFWNYNSSK